MCCCELTLACFTSAKHRLIEVQQVEYFIFFFSFSPGSQTGGSPQRLQVKECVAESRHDSLRGRLWSGPQVWAWERARGDSWTGAFAFCCSLLSQSLMTWCSGILAQLSLRLVSAKDRVIAESRLYVLGKWGWLLSFKTSHWSNEGSVGWALDSWLKVCEFESWWENFILQS